MKFSETDIKVVFAKLITKFRSQVRTLSSVEGLRQMVSLPFNIVRTLRGNKNSNEKENNEKTI